MTVTVRMHGNLRRFLPDGRDTIALDVEAGATVDGILRRLGVHADTWLVALNGAVTERSEPVNAGDLLECYEPVAGGCARKEGNERCPFAT